MKTLGLVAGMLLVVGLAATAGAESGTAVEVADTVSDPGATVDAQVTVVPFDVGVHFPRDVAATGRLTGIRATVVNLADVTVRDVTAELRIEGSVDLTPDAVQPIGQLEPNSAATVVWRMCGREAATVVGVVRVEGTLGNDVSTVAVSDGFVFTVIDAPGRGSCPPSG
jgi:hypothetical protein